VTLGEHGFNTPQPQAHPTPPTPIAKVSDAIDGRVLGLKNEIMTATTDSLHPPPGTHPIGYTLAPTNRVQGSISGGPATEKIQTPPKP